MSQVSRVWSAIRHAIFFYSQSHITRDIRYTRDKRNELIGSSVTGCHGLRQTRDRTEVMTGNERLLNARAHSSAALAAPSRSRAR